MTKQMQSSSTAAAVGLAVSGAVVVGLLLLGATPWLAEPLGWGRLWPAAPHQNRLAFAPGAKLEVVRGAPRYLPENAVPMTTGSLPRGNASAQDKGELPGVLDPKQRTSEPRWQLPERIPLPPASSQTTQAAPAKTNATAAPEATAPTSSDAEPTKVAKPVPSRTSEPTAAQPKLPAQKAGKSAVMGRNAVANPETRVAALSRADATTRPQSNNANRTPRAPSDKTGADFEVVRRQAVTTLGEADRAHDPRKPQAKPATQPAPAQVSSPEPSTRATAAPAQRPEPLPPATNKAPNSGSATVASVPSGSSASPVEPSSAAPERSLQPETKATSARAVLPPIPMRRPETPRVAVARTETRETARRRAQPKLARKEPRRTTVRARTASVKKSKPKPKASGRKWVRDAFGLDVRMLGGPKPPPAAEESSPDAWSATINQPHATSRPAVPTACPNSSQCPSL